MGSLVADIGHGQRHGAVQLALKSEIPGVNGGKPIWIVTDLDVVSIGNGDEPIRWDRRENKGGGTDGKVERRRVGAAAGEVLVSKNGQILSNDVAEDGAEYADIEAASIPSTNDR